eukprot:scaffold75209_cov29-Attheya_sp.AAC.2
MSCLLPSRADSLQYATPSFPVDYYMLLAILTPASPSPGPRPGAWDSYWSFWCHYSFDFPRQVSWVVSYR